MGISAQLHRQRTGLNYSNLWVKKTSNQGKTFPFKFYSLFLQKIGLFLSNSLSINVGLFIFLSQIACFFYNVSDPILSSLFGIFTTVFSINAAQFTLIYGYATLNISTMIFYTMISFFTRFDNSKTFIKFFSYKLLDMLTHGDVHPHLGPLNFF